MACLVAIRMIKPFNGRPVRSLKAVYVKTILTCGYIGSTWGLMALTATAPLKSDTLCIESDYFYI